LLLYIFSLIGATTRKIVDVGASIPDGSNTANLLVNHGWLGLLLDGNEQAISAARDFYARCPTTKKWPPLLSHTWITVENINELIAANGFSGEIDLLSLDLDGVDYWIWNAIDCVNPRVVVVEYQDCLGPEKALTVPYRPDFRRSDYTVNAETPIYVGASLAAFVKLGRAKGYRLIGCNRYGYNAFFLRNDVGQGILPEIPIHTCFSHPWNIYSMERLYPKVRDMEWVEV
jgi:hypothetical protein